MGRAMRRKREKKACFPIFVWIFTYQQGNSVLVSGIALTHDAEPTTLSRITWPLALFHYDKENSKRNMLKVQTFSKRG